VSGGGVGAKGIQVIFATNRHPGTNTKRLQIVIAVTSAALSLVLLSTKLLGLSVQFLIEIPLLTEDMSPKSGTLTGTLYQKHTHVFGCLFRCLVTVVCGLFVEISNFESKGSWT